MLEFNELNASIIGNVRAFIEYLIITSFTVNDNLINLEAIFRAV